MLLKVVLIVLMSEMSIQAHQHSEPVVNNDVFLERFYNLIEELEIVIKEVIASESLFNSVDPDQIHDSSRSILQMSLAEKIQKKINRVLQRRNKITTVVLIPEYQALSIYPTTSVHPISQVVTMVPPAPVIATVPASIPYSANPPPLVSSLFPASPIATMLPPAPVIASAASPTPYLANLTPLVAATVPAFPIATMLPPVSVSASTPAPIPYSANPPPLVAATVPTVPIATMLSPASLPATSPLPLPAILLLPLPAISPASSPESPPAPSAAPSLAPLSMLSSAPLPSSSSSPSPSSLPAPLPSPSSALQPLVPLPPLVFTTQSAQSNPSQEPLTVPLTTTITESELLNLSELVALSFPEDKTPNEWPFIINKI